VCAAVTTLLLLFASGLPLAEGQNLARYMDKDGYTEYRAGTSILIPLVGYRHIPNFIRRTILCEWGLYAYKQPLDEEQGVRDGAEYSAPELVEPSPDTRLTR
jgi:hypothetical protein